MEHANEGIHHDIETLVISGATKRTSVLRNLSFKNFLKKSSHLFSIFFLRSSTFYKVVSDTSGQLASHLKFIQVFT